MAGLVHHANPDESPLKPESHAKRAFAQVLSEDRLIQHIFAGLTPQAGRLWGRWDNRRRASPTSQTSPPWVHSCWKSRAPSQ
jgi:hypothetical protein